jgi:hypothetical protein
MGESKRRRQEKWDKTIGEYMDLRPGEPMVLKLFSGQDVLHLVFEDPSNLDEEAAERMAALQAVMQQATSGNPPHCVICRDAPEFPGLIGFVRGALKGPRGAVFIVCMPCSAASEDIRNDIVEALGEQEIKTSDWAS